MELPRFLPERPSERRFDSPEEELVFLRKQVEEKERELTEHGALPERTKIIKEHIGLYQAAPGHEVLTPKQGMSGAEQDAVVLKLAPEEHDAIMSELLGVLQEKGVHNALSVVHKMNNPHVADDFHRLLVQYIAEGLPVTGLTERSPLFRELSMVLYEVALPERGKEEKEKQLKELISSMEQFYSGMLGEGAKGTRDGTYFSLEIALPASLGEVSFFAGVPVAKKDLFEKQVLSLFPGARVEERADDYNIFSDGGFSVAASASLTRPPLFPLKTYDQFDYDPLNVITNAFSKLKETGEGAALQLVVHPAGETYLTSYRKALEKLNKGVPTSKAIRTGFFGLLGEVRDTLLGTGSVKKDAAIPAVLDQIAIEALKQKIASPIVEVNVRLIASAGRESRAHEILGDLIASFNQFENAGINKMRFIPMKDSALNKLFRAFSYRSFEHARALPLNLRELTTMMHFPSAGIASSPHVKHAKAATAPAPVEMAHEGIVLGVNRYRSGELKVVMTREDRLRHFYCIGQTGTGKSTLLKNMIIQDIQNGEGVCMIDPHGSDITDVLAAVPPERFGDVIYFDPGYTERPLGLNMLEYDERFPEQKTFVVNELFSIFKKLYGATPEAMGPAFEQYFRNATLLTMDHPQSGNTLLDVSRVLSDKTFRHEKLAHSHNPLIKQFWENAEKTTGEQSLANFVQYVTNKFDVFLANDIMRPIVAQEHSAFNFRTIMDERKILLVNLAKGRLGDINANLIGLILVGKILMAALSRVDSFGGGGSSGPLPPFYLYIDEFQNITTDSIATILSEARKYGLSLTMAHQFIAQLTEDIRNAVFGNVGTLCAFRVGAEDAQVLGKQFEPVFTPVDLMNLDNRNAYIKLLVKGKPAKAFNFETLPPPPGNQTQVDSLRELSYRTFGRERSDVERAITEKYVKRTPAPTAIPAASVDVPVHTTVPPA